MRGLDARRGGGGGGCDVLYAGDMNWNKDNAADPAFPTPAWRDVWSSLRPRDPGLTYDGPRNPMLANSLKGRLDRVWARLGRFRATGIELVGTGTGGGGGMRAGDCARAP